MTSNDRHASHDSPYRTGRHIPIPQSRHAALSSVATGGVESRVDLSSSYTHEEPAMSNGFIGSPRGPMSPNSPYSPGMRSSLSRQPTTDGDAFDKGPNVSHGEIPMQNFSEGLPPPPPVSHSWKRIDRWIEDNYTELFDNVCEGATGNDVNELEHELDATLPMDVRESLQVHDGQERGGLPTGVLFGLMLLDCEEIVQEWQNWRKVAEEYLTNKPDYRTPQIPAKAFASSSTAPPIAQPQPSGNPLWRQDLQARQDSQPPNAVQKAYAHPAWIPLARDWGGNYLAVDLAPGSSGTWGQIIIFGRDYDCKFVVARSWGALLAMIADDLGSENVHIDEDSGELKLLAFKRQNVEPPYLEVLRWRCDQKNGRRPIKRRPHSLRVNPNAPGGVVPSSTASSPYSSPVLGPEDRGRSPHRLSLKTKGVSPRGKLSSPLARVAEESMQPLRVHTDAESKANAPQDKLIPVDTPRPSDDFPSRGSIGSDKENKDVKDTKENKAIKSPVAETSELKTVEI
ncbi:cell wall assembly and cell proliferation coordinating protein [Dothidotthia symphoricarpi CBS 119687]|uniref:Cell wall assembly and cell proliferation coordinating protein n=1 Tax=Dothidotthia symphoricarpi CBS 119687 TaxID=1392245 RepID=A0A6A6ABT1_9PLEO|nr:cell wall assembly and cell proliferation coordinating protein [Dothidotthia symphoricarpi CBS 119687]KAF2128474.1 cell wall assembly and cell proliferation coordinating protein [Dothidotthia symphoricarpi CBS 119687]